MLFPASYSLAASQYTHAIVTFNLCPRQLDAYELRSASGGFTPNFMLPSYPIFLAVERSACPGYEYTSTDSTSSAEATRHCNGDALHL